MGAAAADGTSFDRVRPRRGGARVRPGLAAPADPQGKRALFSDEVPAPAPGSVGLDCERCGARSVVSLVRLARLSLPGLHVVVPRDGRPAWRAYLTCPECRRRSWASLRVR